MIFQNLAYVVVQLEILFIQIREEYAIFLCETYNETCSNEQIFIGN